jgi:hypothetical protein
MILVEKTLARFKRPSTTWTKHLQPAEQASFEETLKNSHYILRRLKAILEEELKAVETEDAQLESLDNPNWTFKQAANLGQKARLRKTLTLLEFLD